MSRFLKASIYVATILIVLTILLILFQNLTSLTQQRRQPITVEISENESPFTVSDLHEGTRDWIDERLNYE